MMDSSFLISVVLPVVALAGMAYVLPLVLTPRDTRSQRRVVISVVVTAAILLVVGIGIMAGFYALEGHDVSQAFERDLLVALRFFANKSATAVMIWGPVLALAWIGLAQKVERRKSQDGMRGTTDQASQDPPRDL